VIYRLDDQLVEGAVSALVLSRNGREIARQPATDESAGRQLAWQALRMTYTEDLQRIAGDGGAFTDSPMRWASGGSAENLVEEALMDVRPGDATPLPTRYPRRWFYARERGQWFLPPDMRDIRWDRPEHDAFAAHPAWERSRAVVRERPVPEHAWNGVLFASRPSSGAFGAPLAATTTEPIMVIPLDGASRRAIVVVTAPVTDDQVREVSRSLEEAGVEHLWLSHPMDWNASLSDLPWAAAARDERRRDVVVVDGLGVFRADAFAKAFRDGDPRVTPAAVRARMAQRVAALRSSRTVKPDDATRHGCGRSRAP
jgi:hypothetical protein